MNLTAWALVAGNGETIFVDMLSGIVDIRDSGHAVAIDDDNLSATITNDSFQIDLAEETDAEITTDGYDVSY